MNSLIKQIKEVREGGMVERAHTLRHLGSYNNAQHQWGAAMLYMQLRRGSVDPITLQVILTHDIGERWVGDFPAPAKWQFTPEAGAELADMEHETLTYLGFNWPLEPDEARWAKAVDLLEFYLWCLEQQALGNRNVDGVISRVLDYVREHIDEIPEEVQMVYDEYSWSRTPDLLPKNQS